ncbi:CGNR zinc finger domain-containing protein [Rhodococcus sp. IEGM 1401]|uniref:CGNR zinc finger domain-containing protein n=1 Tax=unclassified Rhodococcus (in: high G+C Gram-positive bacteria) TaxID=192944 RepID=UPI000EF89E7A|nr:MULTISPECIES: CGNR zinc finger domain-containing protein [unclassified Rhodococcus (in: high G+C Gram-positive bacteria)]MCZ4562917.1 CGNR zinc finger domain-containing protein [Rhodococcus sp. IEGM 1401]MDI9923052.1 CGNR zinc finger domain-containing protein [Rhodococcus sp. IEGM 1372]MDV8035587.1 CGNR zinc finger domain-containing protein [Rhodococcus sp. IEGM 1414]RMB78328.1 CGNR zinc finger domain-containing protein [Rhodococcus sp. SBT000017]
MSPTPTERFHLASAPDGLHVVQDLLNTRAIAPYGLPDLIADGETASTTWGTTLSDEDAAALRTLRSDVEAAIAGDMAARPAVRVELVADADGSVRLAPTGTGADYIASQIWAEILLAQQSGTWPRLKRCKNEACGSAFYDRSRNNSGVWHDVKTCGNVANLRASRARKKAQT